jgi:3-deoxy-D-manno-octulosonic-acid transferase
MAKFLSADAMRVVKNAKELGEMTAQLLKNTAEAAAIGKRARQVVATERGATDRHVKAILDLL